MQKFVVFVLQLYLAVVLTLFATDQVMAHRRLAQFKQMEDCCVTAADQYASFSAVYRTASTLDELAKLDELSRLDRYRAISAWEQALLSSAKNDITGEWDKPGADAADRIASFLARRRVTSTAVGTLAQKYRAAGPDVDPELDALDEKTAKYLVSNLTYLGAVTGVARTELREILTKQAGGPKELDAFVASRATAPKPPGYQTACTSFLGADSASSLGRAEQPRHEDSGFLTCVRNALTPST